MNRRNRYIIGNEDKERYTDGEDGKGGNREGVREKEMGKGVGKCEREKLKKLEKER